MQRMQAATPATIKMSVKNLFRWALVEVGPECLAQLKEGNFKYHTETKRPSTYSDRQQEYILPKMKAQLIKTTKLLMQNAQCCLGKRQIGVSTVHTPLQFSCLH